MMKKQYNIIIGLALLAAIAACYAFKETKYFSVKTGEEIQYAHYENNKEIDEFDYLIREESYLNYEAGFTAGVVTLGFGFLFVGLYSKKKS